MQTWHRFDDLNNELELSRIKSAQLARAGIPPGRSA